MFGDFFFFFFFFTWAHQESLQPCMCFHGDFFLHFHWSKLLHLTVLTGWRAFLTFEWLTLPSLSASDNLTAAKCFINMRLCLAETYDSTSFSLLTALCYSDWHPYTKGMQVFFMHNNKAKVSKTKNVSFLLTLKATCCYLSHVFMYSFWSSLVLLLHILPRQPKLQQM